MPCTVAHATAITTSARACVPHAPTQGTHRSCRPMHARRKVVLAGRHVHISVNPTASASTSTRAGAGASTRTSTRIHVNVGHEATLKEHSEQGAVTGQGSLHSMPAAKQHLSQPHQQHGTHLKTRTSSIKPTVAETGAGEKNSSTCAGGVVPLPAPRSSQIAKSRRRFIHSLSHSSHFPCLCLPRSLLAHVVV